MENYQKELDKLLEKLTIEQRVPSLLLHVCCAPCSSYTLEYLAKYFHITVFFYNPNIAPEPEYRLRAREVQRLIAELPVKYPVSYKEGDYDPWRFQEIAIGKEEEPEGGSRCHACYALRLSAAAKAAAENGYDYFTTTLTISPYKNAQKLNELGAIYEQKTRTAYLHSDFKKKNGYQRSIQLSNEYKLYRQDYCGCIHSQNQAEARRQNQISTHTE